LSAAWPAALNESRPDAQLFACGNSRGDRQRPPAPDPEIYRVSPFKNPSFQDRIDSAAEAKKKALEQLRSRPAPDEKVAAERQAKRLERQTRDAEKAAAKKTAQQALKDAKAAEAAARAAAAVPPTEAERKAARDARYAARKARK
jgi:membrane protein involved in colicin uptake